MGPFCFGVTESARFTFNYYFTIYCKLQENGLRIIRDRTRCGTFRDVLDNTEVDQGSFYCRNIGQ